MQILVREQHDLHDYHYAYGGPCNDECSSGADLYRKVKKLVEFSKSPDNIHGMEFYFTTLDEKEYFDGSHMYSDDSILRMFKESFNLRSQKAFLNLAEVVGKWCIDEEGCE